MTNPIVSELLMPTGTPALRGNSTRVLPGEVRPTTEVSAAARYARQLWRDARPVISRKEHFYLDAYAIDPSTVELRMNEQRELLIPLLSPEDSKLANLQKVLSDGSQTFIEGGRTKGCYALLSGTEDRVFCIDFATGWTIWRATGRSVVVCMSANNIAAVIAGLGTQAGDCIAVDNDSRVQPNHHFNEQLDAYGMSYRSAMNTGLPFYMPPAPSAGFNHIGVEVTADVFARPPVSSVPIIDAWTLASTDSPERKPGNRLMALKQITRPELAAEAAYTLATDLASQVPVQTGLLAIRQRIETALPSGVMHPATLDGIMQRLGQAQSHRREAALAPITLPERLTRCHRYERHTQLPTLGPDDWRGVIVTKSPMASGKTQKVGRPFADWADETGERFLAICHRISLTSELADRLKLSHYQHVDASTVCATSGLAVCLPSITLPRLAPLIDHVGALFIDEVAQVLRFLEADGHCRTSYANSQDVYHRLQQIIRRAKCVVVADAGADSRTIEFLEACRPGEQFRIIEVPEPQDAGIHATFNYASEAPALAVSDGLAELAANGKLWIATESKKRAKVLQAYFAEQGYRTLAIHSDNKGNKPQRAFLNDAEGESLRYDVVIASPVIGSGLSIEHHDVPRSQRFTLGLYIGGGHSTPPADAAQQLRRVRYLKNYVLALLPNPTATGNQSPAAILGAAEQAVWLEGQVKKPTAFDALVADVRASDANARADFAAGLLWQLDAAGWSLTQDKRAAEPTLLKELRLTSQRVTEAHRAALIAAPILSEDEAQRLDRLRDRNDIQNLTLEAHQIRQGLGLVGQSLNEAIIEFWDDGRIEDRLDRFGALRGIVPDTDNDASPVTSGRYWTACAKAYAWLLEGFSLEGLVLTSEVADAILDRMIQRRHLLSALGIVDGKYAEWREDKEGKLRPMPRPGHPVKEVNRMLKRLGLETREERRRCDTSALSAKDTCASCVPPTSPPKPAKKGRGNPIIRFYRPTSDSIAFMSEWVALRNSARRVKKVSGGQDFDLNPSSTLAGDFPSQGTPS